MQTFDGTINKGRCTLIELAHCVRAEKKFVQGPETPLSGTGHDYVDPFICNMHASDFTSLFPDMWMLHYSWGKVLISISSINTFDRSPH